jgi:hypothetical protein
MSIQQNRWNPGPRVVGKQLGGAPILNGGKFFAVVPVADEIIWPFRIVRLKARENDMNDLACRTSNR